MTQILSLPVVILNDVVKIHDFYQKMNLSVKSLRTLKKLSTVGVLVRMALDKLECIKSDLIRTDDEWREWDFPKLVGALREWTFRNPLRMDEGTNNSDQRTTQNHSGSGRKEDFKRKKRSQNLVFIATRTTIACQIAKK